MLAHEYQINDLNELKQYVYETICNHEQLELGVFPMSERILVRKDQPCGIHFCLHGPRSVRFTAIWETDRNTILFYGSNGERFHRIQLTSAPQLATMPGTRRVTDRVCLLTTPELESRSTS